MKKFMLILAAALLPAFAQAQIVVAKGVGTISYKSDLTPQIKEQAYAKAQVAAVERYYAENGESESENFEAIEDKVAANLDKFILSTTVINEQDQASLHKYSVAVRVELNVAKLRNTLRKSSTVKQTANAEKSQLVYVFVGREAASVRAYDARVVQRAEVTEDVDASYSRSSRGKEGEKVRGNSVATSANRQVNESASVKSGVKIETGGSTTRKADDTSYRLLPMNNTKTSITSVFSQGGFNVADPEFVLGDQELKAVNKDFSAGNDLAPSTMRAVVQSLRKANVPYLVLATLDVGAPDQDAATGLQRVAVVVTGRVLDLTGTLPREVASVPAVQYFGVGQDNASAMNKALKDASLAAAREVVSRMNVEGVR